MSMADMIDERLVSFGLDVTNKEDAIRKICKMMYDAGKVSSYEDYLQGVKDRELEFETGMGNGIAIPHCKGGCVKEAAFTLVKLNQKIEWGSLDGEPVDYVIMLAAPNTADNVHLKMLSSLAVGLMDDDFREALKDATDVDQIIDIFKKVKRRNRSMYLVAVCSCPVGIAHTYMAAANLKKAAQKKGIEIKVETQGAQGVEDEITAEDIARCDACIIASDVKIKGSSRFKDVPTMSFKVNEPIKDADAVIDELVEALG